MTKRLRVEWKVMDRQSGEDDGIMGHAAIEHLAWAFSLPGNSCAYERFHEMYRAS